MVKAEMGSFDSRAWHEAEWTMRFWNRQRTIESVYASLDILDRMLRENCYQQRQHIITKENPAIPEVLTTTSLNVTLHNWQACAKRLESSPRHIASLPSPTSILDTIDYWKMLSLDSSEHIPLKPNCQSFSIIIDTLAFAQHHALQNDYIVPRDAPGSSAIASRDSYGNVAWQFSTTPAPIIAEKLLHRLVQESKSDPALKPSIITYNNVINAWSRSGHPKAPEKAEEILRTLQAMTNQPGWEDMLPTTSTYGSVIHAWANSKSPSAAKRAEQLVKEMESAGLELNGAVHLGVLKAWISSPDPQASRRATDWLQGMVKAYLEKWQQEATREEMQDATTTDLLGLKKNKPTIKYFLSVLNVYVKRGEAMGARAILDQLHNLYETCGQDPDFRPNADVYNCVLRAWAKSRSSEAYQESVKLMQIMRDLAESTGNASLVPNIVSYNALLSSSRHETDMQRAEDVFSLIERTPGIKPDLTTYNTMLDVMAKSLRKDAAERAEAVLRRMWGLYSSKGIDSMPDSTSYNACMNACKFANDPFKAEALFREMQDRYQQTGNRRLKPNKMSYGSLITAWANSKHTHKAERAQEIFDSMVAAGIRPSTIEYNATIHAWASVGNVERAESLLDRALEEYTAGNTAAKPDVKTFSSLLNALAKRKSLDPWRDAKHAEAILMRMEELSEVLGADVKPNTFSFNTVLDSFARCKKNKAAPKHAERILQHMLALREAGLENLKPTVISYTTVMNCWVQSLSEETVDRVQQLFDDLKARYVRTGDEDLKPSSQTYNALFGAFARDTKKADSLDRAMQHFDNLVEQYEQTKDIKLRPAPMHFSCLLSAFSRRGMVDEAEQFLERVLHLCRGYSVSDGEKLDVSSSFNAVIVAHAKSNQPGAANKAQQALRRMQVLDATSEHVVAPTSVGSYTSVMMAWSLVSDPDEKDLAVAKCEELLQEMLDRTNGQDNVSAFPNQYTFGTILQVIARSNHPQKKERAERVFQAMQQCRIRPDKFVDTMLEECNH
jgi:tetratricopeptide (TPR) repeat protein